MRPHPTLGGGEEDPPPLGARYGYEGSELFQYGGQWALIHLTPNHGASVKKKETRSLRRVEKKHEIIFKVPKIRLPSQWKWTRLGWGPHLLSDPTKMTGGVRMDKWRCGKGA